MPRILVATGDGLRPFDERGGMGRSVHAGRSVTAMAPAGSDVWVVIDGSELWHHTEGATRLVTDLADVRATCLASIQGDVFVGSAGAHLFRLVGTALEPVSGFEDAAGRDAWYTPWGGPPDTRSIANWDDDVYVNVHVGGILRADDRAGTWTPTIDIDADVHQVTTADGLVLAACAGGLAASADRGSSWSFRTEGLEAPYARAVAVSGSAVLMSASRGPRGGRAAVYRADLSGGPFERCLAGPGWFDGNIDSHHLDALPDGSFAAFGASDGIVYASTDTGSTWDAFASGLLPVQRVLVMP